ncbi:unnamed protein product [Discosporangium mesarthrocarpum]
MDTLWLMIGAILVFFMQTGFAMLEVGSVSVKNTKNILIKNVGDASLGALCWWLVGYGVAFGTDAGGFIGTDGFALKGFNFEINGSLINGYAYASWLFQWAFAATAATIVSGAVAERVSFNAYVMYSIVLTMFIYPVVVHWGWHSEGWASPWTEEASDTLFGCGATDFAGSGVVHMTGGAAALIASIVVGPRVGRFNEDGTANSLPAQSAVLQTLGTLILWFGWYGFNGASTLKIIGFSHVAAKTMVTTTIGAGSGALSSVIIHKYLLHYWDAGAAINGILSGLVSVTAGCSTIEPEGAFVIGVLAGIVYTLGSNTLVKMKIDDVVDASPVHLCNGAWGVIATGFFTTPTNYGQAYYADRAKTCAGVFYGGDGSSLAAAVVFALAILVWVGMTCMILFLTIRFTFGMRVTKEMELIGMDDSKHGGQTYPEMLRGINTSGSAPVDTVNDSHVSDPLTVTVANV